jgi:hypothetical protein
MPSSNLPISRLINVSVVLSPAAAQAQDLSTMLLLGGSDVIDVVERMREYTSLDAVAADFGTTAPEYLTAVLWFEQNPQPTQINIGRWARTATVGELICAPLASPNNVIATWNAIVDGGFKIAVDGGAVTPIQNMDFTQAANLNAVAAIITAAMVAAGLGASCVYNSVYTRFEFESDSAGPPSAISFLTAPDLGTDVSAMLAGLSTSSGAYVADGIAVETAVTAATLFDTQFGQQWYALVIPQAVDADHLAVGAYIEGCNNKHLYGVTTQAAGTLSSVDQACIAYLLAQLRYKRTVVQYSSQSAYAVASLLGRALTVNYNGNQTVITLMYKQEPGIVAENLQEPQLDALEDKNCNVFVNYNNNTAIIEKGVVSSGDFLDIITGTDAWAIAVMNALYNLLYTSPTKIPQTDAGAHILVTTVESVCSQFVRNGMLAPGVWNSFGFGALNQGDFLGKGFYVYIQPMAQQTQADRERRVAPPIQVAGKLAGAVHEVDVTLNVNR